MKEHIGPLIGRQNTAVEDATHYIVASTRVKPFELVSLQRYKIESILNMSVFVALVRAEVGASVLT